MVQIIAGEKGKGKTKHLLDWVNQDVSSASGNIVYLDKSARHMYELNKAVRLIDISDYLITNCDEFMGFICGIVSQDHDLEEMFLDSFLTIAQVKEDELCRAITKLQEIGEMFHVNFVLSVSKNEADLPEYVRSKIIISL